MKKVLLLASVLLLAGGCGNNKFDVNYDKMQVSDDGINGYSLDLRIYGIAGDERINEIVRIENYDNKDYKITKINTNMNTDTEDRTPQEETIYILDGKTYVIDEEEKYIESTGNVDYSNPSIYLNGLKKVTKTSKAKEETIGTLTYDVYDVTFDKKNIDAIIDDTGLDGIELKDDVTGKIYLNKDGYVYRVIYNIGDLTINANYFGINTARAITLPNDIENDHITE